LFGPSRVRTPRTGDRFGRKPDFRPGREEPNDADYRKVTHGAAWPERPFPTWGAGRARAHKQVSTPLGRDGIQAGVSWPDRHRICIHARHQPEHFAPLENPSHRFFRGIQRGSRPSASLCRSTPGRSYCAARGGHARPPTAGRTSRTSSSIRNPPKASCRTSLAAGGMSRSSAPISRRPICSGAMPRIPAGQIRLRHLKATPPRASYQRSKGVPIRSRSGVPIPCRLTIGQAQRGECRAARGRGRWICRGRVLACTVARAARPAGARSSGVSSASHERQSIAVSFGSRPISRSICAFSTSGES